MFGRYEYKEKNKICYLVIMPKGSNEINLIQGTVDSSLSIMDYPKNIMVFELKKMLSKGGKFITDSPSKILTKKELKILSKQIDYMDAKDDDYQIFQKIYSFLTNSSKKTTNIIKKTKAPKDDYMKVLENF